MVSCALRKCTAQMRACLTRQYLPRWLHSITHGLGFRRCRLRRCYLILRIAHQAAPLSSVCPKWNARPCFPPSWWQEDCKLETYATPITSPYWIVYLPNAEMRIFISLFGAGATLCRSSRCTLPSLVLGSAAWRQPAGKGESPHAEARLLSFRSKWHADDQPGELFSLASLEMRFVAAETSSRQRNRNRAAVVIGFHDF